MVRSDLLGIILRLGAGFIILVAFSFFLWSRLRKNPTHVEPSPTPTTITIVTPTPSPTPETLPTVAPTNEENKGTDGEKGKDDRQQEQPKPHFDNSKKQVTKTYVIETTTEETTYISESNETSAWAEAHAENAWARAESSAN
jgi:hypothetical protein